MTSRTRILAVVLALAAAIVAFDAVYSLGYRYGSRDALNWNFSAVIGGNMVPVGHGSSLLRARLDLKPVRNRNMVALTFSTPIKQFGSAGPRPPH